MIHAKLFVLNQEIILKNTDMRYARMLQAKGYPSARLIGGKITVSFETREDTVEIIRWMTRCNGGSDTSETEKMEDGKIVFYEGGLDGNPAKTYEFKDAYVVHYKESWNARDAAPLLTTMTISPAVQNYGALHLEPWNISHVEKTEELPYQPMEIVEGKPRIYDIYYEDMDGNRIKELPIGSDVHLVVASENVSGKTVNINLSDRNSEFHHNGELLEDDILKDITLSGDKHKEKLKVVAHLHEI